MDNLENHTYKLYREKGYLFFNSFKDREFFWVSTQNGGHGGGAMYEQISHEEFENVFEGKLSVGSFQNKFNNPWSAKLAAETERKFNIRAAIDAHNLGQYLQKNHDGKFVPQSKPLKSIIPANKQRQFRPSGGTH
jgi:hypothetical protein